MASATKKGKRYTVTSNNGGLMINVLWNRNSDVQVNVQTIPSGSVVKDVSEDLNLTCRVSSNASPRYKVTWSLPIKINSENARVSIYKHQTELTVTIHHLEEGDSGQYMCEVTGNGIHMRNIVRVTVKPDTQNHACSETFFPCTSSLCIPKRYLCDGFEDCHNAKDESPNICGPDSCKGKIPCDDGRCLSPELCCDPAENPDCRPYLVPCCQKILSSAAVESYVPVVTDHARDITFMQSTVYTIVSCIVAFIFITLIMVIAICRIHMKKSAMSLNQTICEAPESVCTSASPSGQLFNWPRNNESRSYRWSDRDEDGVSRESLCQSQLPHPYPCTISSTGSFIIMYNGPNGVQIMERLPKPPPYSESPSPPSSIQGDQDFALGPPPMYQSVENMGNAEEQASNTNINREE